MMVFPIRDNDVPWIQFYNAGNHEQAYVVNECENGDFVLAGTGPSGVLLTRTDKDGNHLWTQTYTGYQIWSIEECTNGDFILAGTMYYSNAPDDALLIRTDAQGNIVWHRTYGESGPSMEDYAKDVVKCSDGGFAFCGYSWSYAGMDGQAKAWLVRVDADGAVLWSTTYLGVDGVALAECNENGFAIATSDTRLIRVTVDGTELWNQQYDESLDATFRSMVICADGGFAIVGNDYAPIRGVLLLRTNATGYQLWNQTYDISQPDYGWSLVECSDGGFAIIGSSGSGGTEPIFLIRTDHNGDHLWTFRCKGTYWSDEAYSVVETSSDGFAIAGFATEVFPSGWAHVYNWLDDRYILWIPDEEPTSDLFVPPYPQGLVLTLFSNPYVLIYLGVSIVSISLGGLVIFWQRKKKAV
jgi:hypothetical protein